MTTMVHSGEMNAAAGIKRIALAAYAAAILGAAAWGGFNVVFSVALGGAFALGNLAALDRLLARVASPDINPVAAGAAVTVSFYARLGLMAAALIACLKAGWIHIPALLLGLSLTFAAVALWLLFSGSARGAALEMETRI
ncbi:MAG: ATP synthase subunit I [Nitrospinae bacterium]|nr:ATP synthase subunit I [Nitrospinota bacterium]